MADRYGQTAAMEKSVHTREYQIFAATLRETRENAGVTQVELAERIDENQVFVSRYERGETRLDIVQLRSICRALKTTLAGFIRTYETRLAVKK